MKNISILGSTGSIGTQALSVVDAFPDEFNIISLSCFSDIELLEKQIEKYHPEMVAVMDTASAYTLEKHLQSRFPEIAVAAGIDGLIAAATCDKTDLLLTAVSGMIGLRPTLAAIEAGIDIALANKETLVAGGEIVMQAVKTRGVKLLPVDSEHSAIFQSLMGNEDNPIKRVIITASG